MESLFAFFMTFSSLLLMSTSLIIYKTAFSTARQTNILEQKIIKKDHKESGYILTLQIKEQMTCGAANLLSQSCLISKLDKNIRIVEPFLKKSYFGFSANNAVQSLTTFSADLTFFDVFSQDSWNKILSDFHFPLMASWEDFVGNAPRSVVLVTDDWSRSDQLDLETSNFIKYLENFGFTLLRTVHRDPKQQKSFSETEFREFIYEHDQPENITVIFNTFGGITNTERAKYLELVDVDCEKKRLQTFVFNNAQLSTKISNNKKKYQHKYLKQPYLSLMVRTEHMIKGKENPEEKADLVNNCLNKTLILVNTLKQEHQIEQVFLTMDTGRFGSDGYISGHRNNEKDVFKLTMNFVPAVFDNTMSYDNWANSFEDIADSVTSGYVAMLQKDIATEGECLILVGGGQFQQHAHQLYLSKRRGRQPCVIRLDKNCNEF